MIKLNYEEIDNKEIQKSVHLLDLFTKTFCRYPNDYERFGDLEFRCDTCPFQKSKIVYVRCSKINMLPIIKILVLWAIYEKEKKNDKDKSK